MLATRGRDVPRGAAWSHEVKWDGMRLLCERGRLTSRIGNDVTIAYPELSWLAELDLTLDGEVVALSDGVPNFGRLAERIHVADRRRALAAAEAIPVHYMVFDVLRIGSEDLTGEPLTARRALLDSLAVEVEPVLVSPVHTDGAALLAATAAAGLEGIVSKRLASPYRLGARSPDWLKFPHRTRRSWVVGGWRAMTTSPGSLGALLVGQPTADGLRYRGRVGSGLSDRLAGQLTPLLAGLRRDSSPFTDEVPSPDADGATWVEPILVVDAESLGLSSQGRLRQPSLVGLRTDLDPGELSAFG